MGGSGTSFWKVFLAVLAALILAGICLVTGCIYLLGTAARQATGDLKRSESERRQYIQQLKAQIEAWGFSEGPWGHVRGHVANTGHRTVSFWRATVKFHGAGGAVLQTESTSAFGTLRPGERKTFDVFYTPDPRYENVTVMVDEVWFEGGPFASPPQEREKPTPR